MNDGIQFWAVVCNDALLMHLYGAFVRTTLARRGMPKSYYAKLPCEADSRRNSRQNSPKYVILLGVTTPNTPLAANTGSNSAVRWSDIGLKRYPSFKGVAVLGELLIC